MFNPKYQNTQYYLQRQRKQMNLNLKTNDIKGTIPLNHAQKLHHKLEIAKMNRPIKKNSSKSHLKSPHKNSNYEKKKQFLQTTHKNSSPYKRRVKKNLSSNNIKNYKYNGTQEIKSYHNKFDGRFDVKDINKKKKNFSLGRKKKTERRKNEGK